MQNEGRERSSSRVGPTPDRVQPPMLTNQQLVSAMGHPTRAHAVTVLNEKVASAADIAREISETPGHVSYHLRVLERLGVIELVKVAKTAGGRSLGKYYRAVARSWFDPESWRQVDPAHQAGITSGILSSCNRDMVAAVKSGTIYRPDNHISRTPLTLDEEGYRELVDRLDALLPEVIEVQQHSAARVGRADETIPVKVHIIQMKSPDPGQGPLPMLFHEAKPEPPTLTDKNLISALEHPTRVHAVDVLNERIASAAEIAKEIGRSTEHVSYHLKRLRELNVIELVDVTQTPGGRVTGRYYRALVQPWYDSDSWQQVDRKHQIAITSTILALCNADMAEAVRSRTIHDGDTHISRTPLVLDREGIEEVVALLDQALLEILANQELATKRLQGKAERTLTKVHLFAFESPDPA